MANPNAHLPLNLRIHAPRIFYALLLLAFTISAQAVADPVAVHHPEGTLHGFLSLSTMGGHVLAAGDLLQTVDGDRVTSHLVFHFKDGSIDDEITVFDQKDHFRLISDHHVQKGPYFPTSIDMVVDAVSGQVTVRSRKKNGKEELKSEHMDLPPDLCNGIVTPIVQNLNPDSAETKLSMVVATPAPRLVTLSITSQGTRAFALAGQRRHALGYNIKFKLGGLAGIIAPLVGKSPPDVHIWVQGGEMPTFIREEGPTYSEGPILVIQLASPVWFRASPAGSRKRGAPAK